MDAVKPRDLSPPLSAYRRSAGLVYSGKLAHAGALVAESFSLLESYVQLGKDWRKVRRAALERNLLGKKSTVRAEKVVEAVRRRFVLAPPWLPPAGYIVRFTKLTRSDRAKQNLVLVYLSADDRLFHDVLLDLFEARGSAGPIPTQWEVIQSVRKLRSSLVGLPAWSSALERRWAQGFFAAAKQLGLLSPAGPPTLQPPAVRVEAFAFFFVWLYQYLGSGKMAARHEAFDPYRLSSEARRSLLEEGRQRGWWGYTASEGLFEMAPAPRTLEEWLHGLEARGL